VDAHSSGSGGSAPVAAPGTFVRKASGLVRQASAFDAFIFNVYFINIGIGVAFMILFYPFYPGQNLIFTTFACLLLVLPTSLLYVMFMSAMPRSGGDYVYVTRSVSPAFGFMSNWNWNMWNFYLMGIAGSFMALYGVSGFLRVLASYTDDPGIADAADFAVTSNGTFLISSLLVILLIGLFMFGRGLRAYIKFQKVTFYIAMLGLLIAVIAIAVAGSGGFPDDFNDYVSVFTANPDPYHSVLRSGDFTPSSFSFEQSMLGVTWAFLVLGFGVASSYIGGEIKMSSRVFLKSVTGSVVYSSVVMAVIISVFFAVVGDVFLGSLGLADMSLIGLTFTPTFAELGAMSAGNVFFALVIALGFALWTYVWMPGYILSWSRSMVAWSLDRIVPAKLGEVDQRRQAPVFGLIILLLGSLVSCALFAYTDLLTLTSGALGEGLTFVCVAIAGILFPYRQRAMWQSSPYNGRVFGVPTMSVMGVLALVGMVLVEFLILRDVNSGIRVEDNVDQVIVVFATFFSGLVLYYIAKVVQRRRGVDVTLAYREIPPE
jgi:amino acid transporter